MTVPPAVAVGVVFEPRVDAPDLPVEVMAGRHGLMRPIRSPHVQKTGLALAGFHEYLRPGRILVFGESEVRFLETRSPEERRVLAGQLLAHDIPCMLATAGLRPVAELVEACDAAGVPLLVTSTSTGTAIAKLTARLEQHFADHATLHGDLVDLLGLGVLILGESGIGKSECALDLVVRGHRLVADDTVEIRRRGETTLIGTCPELTRHHMEIRGLGLINVQDLFGVASTRTSKRVELVVQLERWEPGREYDRLGIDDEFYETLGIKIPLVRMPVAPGRNVAILVEVAARNQLLRSHGHHAARRLVERLNRQLDPALRNPEQDVDHGDEL